MAKVPEDVQEGEAPAEPVFKKKQPLAAAFGAK